MYRFEFEKYNGPNSRYTCPKCGRPHCFTRYIDTETNQYLSDDVGICDHKNNCGYHKPPREYFKEHGNGYLSERKQSASPKICKADRRKVRCYSYECQLQKLERLNYERNTLQKISP